MFTYKQVKSLKNLELDVYNYVIKNKDKIFEMNIRELADEIHVSTTTILRFCKKMGCDGYSEFKLKLKMTQGVKEVFESDEDNILTFNCFQEINKEKKNKQLQEAVSLIYQARRIIFTGAGSSGVMAKYGAIYLSNMGKLTQYIDDPYYPIPLEKYDEAVVIALSVSGETPEIIERLNHFKEQGASIISITNTGNNTISKISDISLCYYVPTEQLCYHNVTTQVPVIYLLESIGKHLYMKINK